MNELLLVMVILQNGPKFIASGFENEIANKYTFSVRMNIERQAMMIVLKKD